MTPAKRKKHGPLRFEPDDAGFNRTNALYLAHASDIAYHRAPADAALERLGLKALAFRSKLTRARGFLGVCKTHAVLSFRGTDPVTFPNWLTVVAVRLVECGEYPGRVHGGFSYALGRTWRKRLCTSTATARSRSTRKSPHGTSTPWRGLWRRAGRVFSRGSPTI